MGRALFLFTGIKKLNSGLGSFKSALIKYSSPRILITFPLILIILLILYSPSFAWDRPFNNPNNWGYTGLMEIPNARVLEDGEVRFGAAQVMPYRWYSGGMGILPGLELSGSLTNITNIPTPYTFTNLDRSFYLKYQILPESKELPAVAIGINDFWGTRLFPAEYLVFNRQIFPLDISLGMGRKRLHGPISLPLSDDFGLFGGIELALHERLQVMAEYNPIEYEKDRPSGRGAPEGARYPINIGLRAKLLPGMDLGLSYQRGDTIGLMLHIQSELGKPILPHRSDPPLQVSVDRRPFHERDQRVMIEKIHESIHAAGFSDVSVYTDGSSLIAEFENTKYLSNEKAVGRVLRILLFYSPSDTAKLTAVLRRRDMPILEVSTKPNYLEKFLFGKIPEDLFYSKLIEVKTTKNVVAPDRKNTIMTERDPKSRFKFNVKPDLTTFWLDGSNYVQVRPGIKPYVTSKLWKGANATARYDIPLYSNVFASATPAPDAIRSDQAKYLDRNYSFDRLMIDQTIRLTERSFGRLSAGYFEKEYAGIGGEALHFLGEGKLAMGIEADWVMKRKPKTQFELMDFKRHSILSNVFYYYPGLDVTLKAQYGRFLAGDVGWMLDVNRQYNTGVILGIFYSFTDTDDVKGDFNKDYNHKGVYISLPVRMFLTRDSAQRYNYGMSPWTRDVGATVVHLYDLFSIGKDLMPGKFKYKLDRVKE